MIRADRLPNRWISDPWSIAALVVALILLGVAIGSWLGWWSNDWARVTGEIREGASASHWFGTNAIGQDILARTLASTATAFQTGVLVALMASSLGLITGGLAGYFHDTWIDYLVLWLAGVLDAIPFLLFVAAMAWAMQQHSLSMHIAMTLSFWTTTARLVRAEIIRLKPLPFVESARALGLADLAILRRHLLPNASPVIVVQATIIFVAAIKTEVILSFLGLGIRDGVSWGVMIAESSQDVLAGHFNNFLAGSLALFALVMAFNQLSDTLTDELDPRKDGT
jgi:peptide/nickel transport system permease protein